MLARRVTLLVPLAVFAACAHPRAGGAPAGGVAPSETAEESCILSTGSVSGHTQTITIGLSEAVDPRHAPFPRNDAERLVFRHLYERPVRIDCDGHARPELAGSWDKEDGGRRWTFRLRDDAPPALGDLGLAVTKPAPDSSWPIGTGAYWATSATTTADEIRAHTSRGDTLVFKLAPPGSGGARDLLDAGVDLLVTRERALRDYAATLPNHSVVALPWDRAYVYVTPDAGGTRFDGLEQSVRAEARRAEGGGGGGGTYGWIDLST